MQIKRVVVTGIGTINPLGNNVPDFFKSLGFTVTTKESLPHKIWKECIECPKFPNCDEIAMTLEP